MQTIHYRRIRGFVGLASAALLIVSAAGLAAQAHAADKPIKIAILAPLSITPGQAIPNGAKLAAEDINRAGGFDGRHVELTVYDTKFSTAGAVDAMKKAVLQNHDVAVVGVFSSPAALSLMPYAKRLNVPLVLEAGTAEIGEKIHAHYDEYKNVFQLQLNSYYIAQEVCDAAHSLLVEGHTGAVSAVILSEQQNWTRPLDKAYEECLPKSGIKVKKLIQYAVQTKDFSPVYSQIRELKPNVLIVGMAESGLVPVVQWHENQVPALMLGFNMQAGTNGFWKASNGAAQGIIVVTNGAGGAAVTPKAPTFYQAYIKQFKQEPMLEAYTSYDAVWAVFDAIKKAGSTDTAKVVQQLQATNMVGVTGRVQFYGPKARFAHVLKYGPGLVTGVAFQWQDGKQVVIWPKQFAQGKLEYPSFVHQPM